MAYSVPTGSAMSNPAGSTSGASHQGLQAGPIVGISVRPEIYYETLMLRLLSWLVGHRSRFHRRCSVCLLALSPSM